MDKFESLEDIIFKAEGVDVFQLTAGTINFTNETANIKYPAYFLTNFTSLEWYLNSTSTDAMINDLLDQIKLSSYESDPFIGATVLLSLVLIGIVTASWMQLLLLFLDSLNPIPNFLVLTNLFYSITHTVILSEVTDFLKFQYDLNFSDTSILDNQITYTLKFGILRAISWFLVWCSLTHIVIGISNHKRKNKVKVIGYFLSLLNLILNLIHNINDSKEPFFKFQINKIDIADYFFSYLFLTLFSIMIIYYSILKRKFAYNKKSMSLTIFSIITLAAPFVFLTITISSRLMRSWSIYIFGFSILCVSIVSREWINTIKTLEKKYEKKAVLGRKISSDNFFDENTVKFNDNFNSFLSGNKMCKILGMFKRKKDAKLVSSNDIPMNNINPILNTATSNSNNNKVVQFYDLVEDDLYSVQSNLGGRSILQNVTAISSSTDEDITSSNTSIDHSLMENDDTTNNEIFHPEFNIDPRYLTETPESNLQSPQ